MAKDNQKDVQARRAAMERTKVRTSSKNQDEKSRRKQQLRLERQEQRLAERLERQTAKRTATTHPKKQPKEKESVGWDKKVKSFVAAQKQKVGTKGTEEKDFQIVLGTKHKRILRVFGILAILMVAVILVNSLVPISIWEYAGNVFASSGSGDGFPVSISPSDTNAVLSVGSDVALLGDSSLTLYKSNGKVLFQRQHGYSNPAMCSCTARVMVYDRGGKNLRVENRAKTLMMKETEGTITTACMARNGRFAVVTRGLNYVSDVTVYDSDGNQTFVWHSAGRQVMGVSLSDNGRYMGVVTLQVEGGQGVAEVLVFDTRKGLTLAQQRFEGSVPVSVDMKGNVAVAILNDRVVSVTKSGVTAQYPFEGGSVTCFDNHNDYGTVLVLGMYQDSRNNRLLILDEDLDIISETEVEREVLGVSAKGNRVSLLSSGQVLFYSRGGKPKGESPLETDGKYLVCKGNFAIVLGTDTLQAVYR